MFVIHFISTLLSLYAILLLVNFSLPYLTSAQQPWMTVLDKICEPGVKIGNCIAAKVLPERRVHINVGALFAALACWIARIVLNLFF